MEYPTLDQVESADHITLAKWFRFLHSPGMNAIDHPDQMAIMIQEAKVMDRICDRFKELGGMTPEISKTIGW